jgi:hypothetical protein
VNCCFHPKSHKINIDHGLFFSGENWGAKVEIKYLKTNKGGATGKIFSGRLPEFRGRRIEDGGWKMEN